MTSLSSITSDAPTLSYSPSNLVLPQARRPGMGMQYFEEILDRRTGDLVSIDKGHWITLRELAELLRIGRRRLAAVLHELDFLQIEGIRKNARYRIRDWVISKGFGKRNQRKSDKMPFDVVSPQGVKWIVARWEDARMSVEERTTRPAAEARQALREFQQSRNRSGMVGQEQVCWLADHFPHLTHEQMAQALYLSRQLVDRLMKVRGRQLAKARNLKVALPGPLGGTTDGVWW